MSGVIVDPKATPVERFIDELVAVCRKHGYVIGVPEDAPPGYQILVARVQYGVKLPGGASGFYAEVEAELRKVTPNETVWKPLKVTKGFRA